MATQSSCAGGSSGKYEPKTLTFQADPDRMYELLAWYAKLASLALKTLPDGAATPEVIPPKIILTLVGCNANPTKKDILGWMTDAYTQVSSFFEPSTDKGSFDIKCPLRVVVSYDGTNFGFRFEDNNKKLLTVVISPEICPLAGIEINTYCVEFDQWKTYTDGSCGQYYQLVKANSEECGYVPPIPAGEKLETYCEGMDQWAFFSDGNYGKTPVKLHENSEDCGYMPPPAAGTVLGTKCKGPDLYDIVADGQGGTRDDLNTPNSADCGYNPPDPGPDPQPGDLVDEYCDGTTRMGRYRNSAGGTDARVIAYNSTDCGYSVPPALPNKQVVIAVWNGYNGTMYNPNVGTAIIEYKTSGTRSYPDVVSVNVTETGINVQAMGRPVFLDTVPIMGFPLKYNDGNWTQSDYEAVTVILYQGYFDSGGG